MSLGWFDDLNDAKAYFTGERLVTDAWDDLTDGQKTNSVIQSFNRLYYDPQFSLPLYADASAAELVILKKANGEMAYYLAQHLDDEDRRKGLQAQAVIKAGIVKEDYYADMLTDIPVPPFVLILLTPWMTKKSFGAIDLARDENESVNTKVHEF